MPIPTPEGTAVVMVAIPIEDQMALECSICGPLGLARAGACDAACHAHIIEHGATYVAGGEG